MLGIYPPYLAKTTRTKNQIVLWTEWANTAITNFHKTAYIWLLCIQLQFSHWILQAALDFLVDSLNDEIESVRLNAVNSLHKIVSVSIATFLYFWLAFWGGVE